LFVVLLDHQLGKLGECNSSLLNSIVILTHPRLAADQSEINRIIAEASKGSKFYEASFAEMSVYVHQLQLAGVQNEKKERQGSDGKD
jgi:hypothetical protein